MSGSNLNPNSVIYDHRPTISPKPSPPKKPAPQAQAQQNLNELLLARNSLKVSSVSSLSNLLAMDEQRLSQSNSSQEQAADTGANNNNNNEKFNFNKSNTLPGKSQGLLSGSSSSSIQSNSRFPIYNVNFNEPERKTTSTVSLASSLGPTDELGGSDDDIIDLK